LAVSGGSLGTNAVWNWSTDAAFATSAGTGASISVDPATTTTYYVRAEGDCNTTASVNTSVTVSTSSTAPTGITITNDATCPGTAKALTVTGGSLGTNAIWNWSTDAAFGTSAGTGASISVDPATTTTYYVRAEGDCNTTASVNTSVTVSTSSTAPTGITITNDATCPGTAKTLTVSGGSLGTNAIWNWSTDAAFSTSAGTGASISVDPATTTTYYVRAEGDCNTTASVNSSVTVSTSSTAPTGITITNDATCPGTAKALTVTGGSLGTNAIWNWSTDAAFATSAGTGASISVDPATTTTYYVRAEGDCNTTASVNTSVTVSTSSTAPTGITITNDATCPGTTKTLTVTGGSLGTNAIWNWSTDAAFSTSAGTGASITVDPATTTTYYVRAEGDCNTTASVNTSVTVSTSSTAPTGITITNDATCPGTTKTLTVTGGSLGTNAVWNWSTDAAFSTSAGTGASISVDPATTTTYYVRAEGDCNTTASVNTSVTVSTSSTAPTGITITNDATCPGTAKTLTVSGGSLGTNAIWNWSTDAAFGTSAGTGASVSVDPATTTTYYVRAEGDCNTTASVNSSVTVSTSSTAPTGITITNDATCPGTAKTLTVSGGSLGTNAVWNWSTDAAFSTSAGTGASISVDPATTTTYYVRAEGDCNTTASVNSSVTVSTSSTAATGITITNDATCPGTAKTLTVSGGSLGTNAIWNWSTDAAFGTSAGTGASISVDPATTTTYYVRAEGDCNTTAASSTPVTVLQESVVPASVSVDNPAFCQGAIPTIELSYTGGVIGSGAEAVWYDNPTFTLPEVARGNNQVIPAPSVTTVYYLRIEGSCNTTSALSLTVTVYSLPTPAISGASSVCEPEQEVYTVSGSAGSTWQWSVTGGSISGSSTDATVTVEWSGVGTGVLTVEETSTDGCVATESISVDKYETPVTGTIISGSQLIRR
ncbi:MAG: beta strand repeat-containing protein, partial [Bacteroidota bacterium]